jgi:maltose O-acetyltransferase
MNLSEKEKMISGQLYDASDNEISKDRANSRELIFEFNNAKPGDSQKRINVLKQLLGSSGDTINIEPPFRCDYGYNIFIGNNFYANFGCVILDVNKVIIGENVLFGPNVQVYSATHPTDPALRLTFKELGKPITIGNNVWIGGASIICPGIKIGDNTTIGAGSVVTKDIPCNVVAAGNPCKVIKTC